jgi:hypothetical protein
MSEILFHHSPQLSSVRDMRGADIDDVPTALVRDQIALELGHHCIKTLPLSDPRLSAYVDRLEAHARRVMEFADAVRRGLEAVSN